MNDKLLQIDIELDVKTLESHWFDLKEQEGFINLTPFTYNIEILGAQIEDSRNNIVPLRLGDIIKLQRKIKELIPTILANGTIFYKLKRIEEENKGLLFAFDALGQHYVFFVPDLDSMFEALFLEIGYQNMKKDKVFVGDYLTPSSATLKDYLASLTYNKSLEEIVCDKYSKLDEIPIIPDEPHIIPIDSYGNYTIDLINKVDWVRLKKNIISGDKIEFTI